MFSNLTSFTIDEQCPMAEQIQSDEESRSAVRKAPALTMFYQTSLKTWGWFAA
jgi:hypothetical protein